MLVLTNRLVWWRYVKLWPSWCKAQMHRQSHNAHNEWFVHLQYAMQPWHGDALCSVKFSPA